MGFRSSDGFLKEGQKLVAPFQTDEGIPSPWFVAYKARDMDGLERLYRCYFARWRSEANQNLLQENVYVFIKHQENDGLTGTPKRKD